MHGGLVDCPLCKGLKQVGCPTCGGAGSLLHRDREPHEWTACPTCGGIGVYTCTACQGEGVKQVVPF